MEEEFREACALGNINQVLHLIDMVDINSKNKMNGMTALHWACKRNHNNIIAILKQNGAIPLPDNNGKLPEEHSTIIYNSYLQQQLSVGKNGEPIDYEKELAALNTTEMKPHDQLQAPHKERESNDFKGKQQLSKIEDFHELLVWKNNVIIGCVFYRDISISQLVDQIQNELQVNVSKIQRFKEKLRIPVNQRQYNQSALLFFRGCDAIIDTE